MNMIKWLPNKVLKTRTSNDYPKRFYISLLFNYNSRFMEESEMEEAMTIGKDRDALDELLTLKLILKHPKQRSEGFYYELIDFMNGVYDKD